MVVTTTIVIVAGFKLVHMSGVGAVLARFRSGNPTRGELVEVERKLLPAEIAWDDGPLVTDEGEVCYPVVGWPEMEEADGQSDTDAHETVVVEHQQVRGVW